MRWRAVADACVPFVPLVKSLFLSSREKPLLVGLFSFRCKTLNSLLLLSVQSYSVSVSSAMDILSSCSWVLSGLCDLHSFLLLMAFGERGTHCLSLSHWTWSTAAQLCSVEELKVELVLLALAVNKHVWDANRNNKVKALYDFRQLCAELWIKEDVARLEMHDCKQKWIGMWSLCQSWVSCTLFDWDLCDRPTSVFWHWQVFLILNCEWN